MNLGAGRGLSRFVEEQCGGGREYDIAALTLYGAISVRYPVGLILEIDGRRTILAVEPRSPKSSYEYEERRFVFSCMNESTRMLDPYTFGDYALGILQFGAIQGEYARSTELHLDDDVSLYTMQELEDRTRLTYEEFAELQSAQEKRTGTNN